MHAESNQTTIESQLLPIGVHVRPLDPLTDERGVFVEVFREEWGLGAPLQWNYIESVEHSLRGMKVHPLHDDIVIVLTGRIHVGLRDLRRGASTFGATIVVELSPSGDNLVTIPHGVAHGFYFPEMTRFLVGVSRYWDLEDELGCRYDDQELGITWPDPGPFCISHSDLTAGPLSALMARIEPSQPFLG
jgi:dTDP-4-dehydrorhamnose 3,5-epimerase